MPVLDWIGKNAVVEHAARVPLHLLVSDDDVSSDPASENLIVEGDNLLALRALLPRYAGQVKCIYIDPPYNTGNEGWAYNDNVNSPEMRRWLGDVVGKEAQDLSRHDKWLCMMYPRLVLLRQFLREDGSIFISIDDHELAQLKILMDEVFGAANYVEIFSWYKTETPSNLSHKTKKKLEYVVCYQRGGFVGRFNGVQRSSASDNPLLKPQNAIKTLCFPAGSVRTNIKGSDMFAVGIYGTDTNEIVLEQDATYSGGIFTSEVVMTGRFVWTQENLKTELNKGTEIRIKTAKMIPSYEKTAYAPEVPPNVIGSDEGVGTNENASTDLRQMGFDFDYSKPVSLVQYLINMVCEPDDLVLDAFAGSGTTGHAVLAQNADDGGNRRFILVEMEEGVAAPVTAERVRRAAEGYAFTGTAKTELLRERLTMRTLKRMPEVLADAAKLKAEHEARFDSFAEKVEKEAYVLYGIQDVKETRPGLGGGFRFARVGPPVLDDDDRLNPAAEPDEVARLAFYAATGKTAALPVAERPPLPFVGYHGQQAVFVLGLHAGGDGQADGDTLAPDGVLTTAVLRGLRERAGGHAGPCVVYGAACRIPSSDLSAHGVTFLQLPYALSL